MAKGYTVETGRTELRQHIAYQPAAIPTTITRRVDVPITVNKVVQTAQPVYSAVPAAPVIAAAPLHAHGHLHAAAPLHAHGHLHGAHGPLVAPLIKKWTLSLLS